MTRQFQVYVIGGGAETDEQVTFELAEAGDLCQLTCSYRGKVLKSEGADYFEALCLIREQLAEDRLVPFCYGASINVHPLESAKSEYKGLVAYRLRRGHKVKAQDAVEIFAEGPDVIPTPVDIQKHFLKDWRGSIQQPRRMLTAIWNWVSGGPHHRI